MIPIFRKLSPGAIALGLAATMFATATSADSTPTAVPTMITTAVPTAVPSATPAVTPNEVWTIVIPSSTDIQGSVLDPIYYVLIIPLALLLVLYVLLRPRRKDKKLPTDPNPPFDFYGFGPEEKD